MIHVQRYLAGIHHNIGFLQSQMGRPAKAPDVLRAGPRDPRAAGADPSVIAFQSDLAQSHNNIGIVQSHNGRATKALASYEQARTIQERLARDHPESPDFASTLGGTLHNMAVIDLGRRQFDNARAKLTRAIEWQRKALAVNPGHPSYRQFLANHLTVLILAAEGRGQTDVANEARRDLAELAASDPATAILDARLNAVLNKKETPRNDAERLRLAYRANEKGLQALSTRLFAEALANEPGLADDRGTQHAYNAACVAALAGCGRSKDSPQPDEALRAKLRRQALEWLKDELAAWTKVLDSGPPETKARIASTLQHWKADADLAGIRDEKELAGLSQQERAALKQLWSDVDQVLTKAPGAN